MLNCVLRDELRRKTLSRDFNIFIQVNYNHQGTNEKRDKEKPVY